MSEVKRNVWGDEIPEYLKESPLVFVVNWKIAKENHERMVDFVTGCIGNWGMDTQRVHPETHFYSRTRHWYKPNEDGKTEDWWFMDEYDSAEAFKAMQDEMMGVFSDSEGNAGVTNRHQKLLQLVLPGTTMQPILYSEVESARIEFEPYGYRAAAIKRTKEYNKKNGNSK